MRSPYAVLGVKKAADLNDIKQAYRQLAKNWHPDQNQGDPMAGERFAEIAHAYRMLINPETRAQFDEGIIDARGRRRSRTEHASGASPFSVFRDAWRRRPEPAAKSATAAQPSSVKPDNAGSADADVEGFDEMVNHIFGESAQRRTVNDAPDLDATDLDQDAAAATGARSAKGRTDDPLAVLDELFAKWKTLHRTPSRAADRRHVLEIDIAQAIAGTETGITLVNGQRLEVSVPPGTADGAELRVPVTDEQLKGDALVTISYRAHPQFRMSGCDLHTDHAIDLSEAVLGTQVLFETLDGAVRLTIPEWAGASGGIVISGRGLPRADGRRGDLFVHLRIMLPEKPDERLIELMRTQRKSMYV